MRKQGENGRHKAQCVAPTALGCVALRTQPLRAGLDLCRAFGAGSERGMWLRQDARSGKAPASEGGRYMGLRQDAESEEGFLTRLQ
jgi:hypothetical protein